MKNLFPRFALPILIGIFILAMIKPPVLLSGGPETPPPFRNLLPIITRSSPYTFPAYTVTNIIVVPQGVQLDPEYPELLSNAVKKVQAHYAKLLGGQTFRINEVNGDPIIVKVDKRVEEMCPPSGSCSNIFWEELSEKGFPTPTSQKGNILNTFIVGWGFEGGGFGNWFRESDSGYTLVGWGALDSLKGGMNRNYQIFCEATLGRKCQNENPFNLIAHELGHSFGLLDASRWAEGHPCSTITTMNCRRDLDPRFYPDPEEWNYSIMGYGSAGYFTTVGFNDSCVNPEKTLLKNSRYFGGPGFEKLNFEKCLGSAPAQPDISIVEIEGGSKIQAEDEIIIKVEGILENDDFQVIFPNGNPSRGVEKLGNSRLKVLVPREAVSGDIFLAVTRGQDQKIRSKPFPVIIESSLSRKPIIERVDPFSAKPGDMVTIYGDNFAWETQRIKTTPPVIILGVTRQPEVLEVSKTEIRFKVPLNASMGQTVLNVELGRIDLKTGSLKLVYSNYTEIGIAGISGLEARLESNIKQPAWDVPVKLTGYVSQENSIPEAAEIWVRLPSLSAPCEGPKNGELCNIAKETFNQTGTIKEPFQISGQFIPREDGQYEAVINVYGKEGARCSGDVKRPAGWTDCGLNSRLKFYIKPLQISSTYFVKNSSQKLIEVIPLLCEIKEGGKECLSVPPEPRWYINSRSKLLSVYVFSIGQNLLQLQQNTSYIVSCTILAPLSEVNQPIVGGMSKLCPEIPARAGDNVSINIEFTDQGVRLLQTPEPAEASMSSPAGQGQPAPKKVSQTKENIKSIVGILVNGQRLGFGGILVSIRLPDIVARGATHAVPITISYSGKDQPVSRNLTFRYIVPGSENSGEKFSPGQECDPVKYSCFVMAEQESGSLEKLFCRNMGDGYKWVTQKHTYELCQGKEGITSACKDKEGNETTYYCTGQDWTNEAGWKEYQENLKKAQEASKPHEVLLQGPLLERLRQLEEESKGLSCSLEAYPQRIKVGQEITWIIKIHNFTGAFAEWRGTDNGQELIIPVPVHGFPKPNSPNLWMENYPYPRGGAYTRYAVIRDSEGRTCQTNTLEAVIEDSSITQGLPGGETLTSITRYVNQIQPKTVSKIILLLPPYGQQRKIQAGERTQFSLPDTGGVPQTVQLPITIIYSDGSTGNKTISFAYKGNTCALSNGRCADSNGNTQDNYHCDEFRSDLTGCSPDKDRAHPYCYTKCSPKPTEGTTSPVTPSQPTNTSTQPQNLNCVANGGVCADSAGITPDQTKKCSPESYRSDYTGCSQYYYCYTSCGSNQTSSPTLPQTQTTTSICNGSGEYCADSAGSPKDPGTQCNTGNKAYRNDSAKDQWCQQGTPGWYCWLCQQ